MEAIGSGIALGPGSDCMARFGWKMAGLYPQLGFYDYYRKVHGWDFTIPIDARPGTNLPRNGRARRRDDCAKPSCADRLSLIDLMRKPINQRKRLKYINALLKQSLPVTQFD